MVSHRRDRPRKPRRDGKEIRQKARRRTQRECVKPHAASAAVSPATAAAAALGTDWPRPNLPRLYFSGKFYTDPSTTNNWSDNFDVDKFRPNMQLPSDGLNFNGSWNPAGTATFALVDCAITSSYSPAAGGAPPTDDSLVGQSIEYNRRSVYGKISDLDPQQQTASTLYGVRVNVGKTSIDGTGEGFASLMLPTSFRDMWGAVYNPSAAAYIQGACAVYQGALSLDAFTATDSTFMKECAPFVDAAKQARPDLFPNGALSIRFRVDWYCNDPGHDDFCYGNVTGYITPWLPAYPLNFDCGRQLYTTTESDGVSEGDQTEIALANMAYAAVERTATGKLSLWLDLVNSLYRLRPTGELVDGRWHSPYQDQGVVDVGYFSATFDPTKSHDDTVNEGVTFTSLAEIEYHSQAFEARSCVVDIELSTGDAAAIETRQLALRAVKDGKTSYLLAEADDGFFTRADMFVFHLEGAVSATPDAAKSARIFCSKWGRLQANQEIVIGFDSTGMQNDGRFPAPSGPKVGVPANALVLDGLSPSGENADDFAVTVCTGSDGYVDFPMLGLDCKHPRGYIDGQLYGLRYAAGKELPVKDDSTPSNEKINILLFDVFDGPKNGTASWLVDILPVFQLYANLYPAMDRIVRLDNYGSVVSRKRGLYRVFTSDINDPAYMPTTRDLSAAKRKMIVDWLATDDLPFMNQTKDDVYEALQTVIELEHATMPPYLTALFSIKRGYNDYIADTLRDVSEQEMLHFAIACNILTAIGGQPNISKINFVPKFPGPLPGGLRQGLIVRLRKLSVEQVKTFMAIEAPEEQYLVEDGESTPSNPLQQNKYTIGWVYDAIAEALVELTPGTIQFPNDIAGISPDDPRIAHQVTQPFGDKLFPIMCLDDAVRAIGVIKEEGEGAPACNNPSDGEIDPDTGLPRVAHYFRFAEIVKGKRITIDQATGTFAYNGPRIVIDEEGVYDMQDDPRIEKQPLGSQQRERMESFALKYQALLNGLQIAFTKDPDHFRACYGLMFQLTIAAQPLMEMPALNEDGTEMAGGKRCGVSFQVPISESAQ